MTNPNGPGKGAGYEGMLGPVSMGLGVLGQFYDTYQSNKTARENTDKTIAAQKAEAELAYQRAVEMWHMQNAYNSPEAQMQRFGAAGLNPHLIYGQGNAGNSSGTPQYQQPNLQYRYAAPTYGAAVGSALPTLMAVGTWMQNMRMSETEIEAKRANTDKAEQYIAFLEQKNPREITKLDNLLSLHPYQSSMMEANERKAWETWNQLEREGRHKYGDPGSGSVGMREIERRLREVDVRKRELEVDYYEPAMIMKMVLGGVAALAGVRGLSGIVSRGAGAGAKKMVAKPAGKGSPGRWSSNRRRWMPTNSRD